MDADEMHALEVQEAMCSVLSLLRYLSDELSVQGAGTAKTKEYESSICEAIYNLGNKASPETKMGSFLPSTARFAEVCELWREGEQGVVVTARDNESGGTVTMKTVHPKPLPAANEPEEEDEFSAYIVLRDACFMAACRGHPNLVDLSAVARDPGTGKYCLVMESVGAGQTLDAVLEERGKRPFPERDVRRMMRQILSGAKAMHDRGVVHRAINSSNIHVADGGNVVKIGGFGAATSWLELRAVGAVMRLAHLAPECLVDPLAAMDDKDMDSWSMGCLMLELLTGYDLFELNVEDDTNMEGQQLERIEELLGVSDERSLEAMKPAVDVELSLEVQRYRLQRRGGRLRELVPREVLSDGGFDVLQGLLMCSPMGRLTARTALQYPWFADNADDSPAVWISRVFVGGALALLFVMVCVCLRYWW